MRNIIGLAIGLYLTAALVVFACAAWSFSTDNRWKACTSGPDWLGWASFRAIAWPKTYFDDAEKFSDLGDWLFVQYNPFPQVCRTS